MIQTVIIDDTQKARQALVKMLGMYCPEIEIIGSGENVASGIDAIRKYRPQLVFLDIHMPDGTGFDLLQQLGEFDFNVIFTTAHQEYAVQAFRFSALDFLLKPVDPKELVIAVHKAEKLRSTNDLEMRFNAFLNNMDDASSKTKKIVLKTTGKAHIIPVQDIVRCESDSNYTRFCFKNEKELLVSTTLKEYDELLSGCGFYRVHQSHLVNLSYVVSYEYGKGGYVILKDQTSIPVSPMRKERLLQQLETL